MTDISSMDWMALAQPNEEWEAAVKQMPQRPDLGVFPDITSLRAYIQQIKLATNASLPPLPDIEIKEHNIPARDGSAFVVRVYSPKSKTGCPLAVIFHGGGYCIGDLENEEPLCRRAASELDCVVVNVDYRLSPEHKFPVPVHDCYDAVKWAAKNASSLGADPSKGFVLGGTSAGANLAIVTSLLARDEGLSPPVTGCQLMIPPTCMEAALPEKYRKEYRSLDQNEHADILSKKACELFYTNYARSPEDYVSPLFSPLVWPTGLERFPPSSFQICGADPLRDEGLIFERALRQDQGVKTRVDVYSGMPHGFAGLMPMLKGSQQYAGDSVAGLKWLLEQV